MEQEYLSFAKEIAYKAGEIMINYFKGDNGASYKFDQTIVTKAKGRVKFFLRLSTKLMVNFKSKL